MEEGTEEVPRPFQVPRPMNPKSEFLALFLRHQADLRAFLGSLVRDRNNFDDVLQDTVLTLWEKFDSYDPDRSFGAWARGIAANKVLQFRDRQGRSPTPFSPEAIGAIVDAFDRQPHGTPELGDALDHCLEQLPETSRQALHGWYAESWSIERIAESIGGSTAAAYKTLQRLRAKLLECVERRLTTGREGSS